METSELTALVERPSTTDISIDFARQRIPLALVEENIATLRRLPNLEEGGLDIGTRKDAVILSGSGREIVIYDTGLVRTRFRDIQTGMVQDLVKALMTRLAALFRWDLARELVSFDTDLIYYWNLNKDPARYLRDLVNIERLVELGFVKDDKIPAVGIQLFLTPLDTADYDIRMEIAPARREPVTKFYVQISGQRIRTTFATFGNHLSELTDACANALLALSKQA